jgi:uncharacterized membrane protein YbhN (UPF0104 family)
MSVVGMGDVQLPLLDPTASARTPAARATRRSSWWQRALLLAGAAGLVLLVRSLPRADWAGLLVRVGPAFPLLAAIAVGWMALYARGLRVILNDAVRWGGLIKNRIIGDAFNVVMPFGDVGGDPLRVMHLGAEVGTANAVRGIVLDRLVYATSGFLFSAAACVAALRAFVWDRWLERLLVAYVAVSLMASVVLFLLATSPRGVRWIARSLRLLKVPMPEIPSALSVRTFARALGWNLLGRAGVLAEISVVLLALGQHVRFDAVVAITAIVAVAGIVFTFVPNGIGVNEGAAVLAFTITGYGENIGLAVGLARRARQLLLAAVGVALHTLAGPREREPPTVRFPAAVGLSRESAAPR